MAKRLSSVPVPKPAAPAVPTQFVATRAKGLQIIDTLHGPALKRITSIDTPEGYLEMDAKLAQIRNGKAQWKLAMQPILGPLEIAIKKQKEALAAAKDAAAGATKLDEEVVAMFDDLERHAKRLMADFQAEQKRIADEAAREQEEAAEALREEARLRAIQAASARTPQLRARLEQQRADLEAQAEQVAAEVPAEVVPVKGAASTVRVTKKVRISDPIAFLRAVQDYEPQMGVYKKGIPPLRCTDKKGLEAFLVEIVGARLSDLYREQPGVVLSWPGISEVDEVNIAGK